MKNSTILTAGMILFILVQAVTTFSQQEQPAATGQVRVVMLTREPGFPGGYDAMQKFISKSLRYPVEARDRKITGKVTVTVTVEADGLITKPLVTEGIGYGCDEEALRVVKLMPRWTPAMAEGKAIRTGTTIPVLFMLYPAYQKKAKRASDSD
jgi:protein TonB